MAAAGIGGVEVAAVCPLSAAEADRAGGGFLSEPVVAEARRRDRGPARVVFRRYSRQWLVLWRVAHRRGDRRRRLRGHPLVAAHIGARPAPAPPTGPSPYRRSGSASAPCSTSDRSGRAPEVDGERGLFGASFRAGITAPVGEVAQVLVNG